jgi:hypothetical protein
MYWSTGSQYRVRASTIAWSLSGQAKRRKYQDESTKVSMVSVSRRASAPQAGHLQRQNDGSLASGLPLPSGTRCSGSTTGNCASGTGTSPHCSQWISGIGQPQ